MNTWPDQYGSVDVLSALWELDKSVFRSLNMAGTNVFLDAIMVSFTVLGIPYIMALLSVPLWVRGKKNEAFDLLVSIVVISVSVELIKLAIGRERPFEVLTGVNVVSFGGFSTASDPSFPSAHAARAFAAAAILVKGRPRGTVLVGVAVATMIGLSRIYLGVHWPSDVLAGALFGIVFALALVRLGHTHGSYARFRAGVVRLLDRGLLRTRQIRAE